MQAILAALVCFIVNFFRHAFCALYKVEQPTAAECEVITTKEGIYHKIPGPGLPELGSSWLGLGSEILQSRPWVFQD